MAGIIDTIKLAGVLVLALPAAMAGVAFLSGGQTLTGSVLLVLAVGMIALERWVPTPGDVPELVAQRTVGRVAKEPDGDDERAE